MALTLLRHTTPDVIKGLCYGVTDLKLADSFESELDVVLSGLPRVDSIVTSPLLRCQILAERIASHVSLEVCTSIHWKEMDFGSWEGLRWSDIPRQQIDAWAADFMNYRGHGGESVEDLRDRISGAIADTSQRALVVTHAGCIKAALAIAGDPKGWDAKPAFGEFVTLPTD